MHIQGHRGARGLKPENTLPSFEAAIDAGVHSIETDVHLTRDRVPVLSHDSTVSQRTCRLLPGSHSPDPALHPLIRNLTLTQLRGYRADRNPAPARFPDQDATVTPLAQAFAEHHELDPYTLPTLADLFGFAVAYASPMGAAAGKSAAQQSVARRLIFDIELKRLPFRPELGRSDLESRVLDAIRAARMMHRCVVRSFDHRCVRRLREVEPGLIGAVLIADTAPVDPVQLVRAAAAQIYCLNYEFVDEQQIRLCHAEGIRVLPWTVNDPADWQRLVEWGVDGITTDYPGRFGA